MTAYAANGPLGLWLCGIKFEDKAKHSNLNEEFAMGLGHWEIAPSWDQQAGLVSECVFVCVRIYMCVFRNKSKSKSKNKNKKQEPRTKNQEQEREENRASNFTYQRVIFISLSEIPEANL